MAGFSLTKSAPQIQLWKLVKATGAGKAYKTLTRHLSTNGYSLDSYREHYVRLRPVRRSDSVGR
jgi:hypothetical protein